MNRGIARRTLFERRQDFRHFMAQLARAVHRGEIEVHAFCLMATHYHLLVRSPCGDLARAMARIQRAYSGWFNRSRRRDGPLVRARYASKLVRSERYRRILVAYIDANPCKARVVRCPSEYPYGSAIRYATPDGPRWLERRWVEGVVLARSGCRRFGPDAYRHVFGVDSDDTSDLVEARLSRVWGPDPLDDLVGASSAEVRAWMERKSLLADGSQPDLPVLPIGRLERHLAAARLAPFLINRGRVRRDAWQVVFVGLARHLCGISVTQLADRLQVSHSKVSKLDRLHRGELARGGDYSARAASVAHAALQEWRSV